MIRIGAQISSTQHDDTVRLLQHYLQPDAFVDFFALFEHARTVLF